MSQNKQNPPLLQEADEQQDLATHFVRGVERILRPIARMLIERGFGVLTGLDMMKRAFVQGAADVVQKQGFPATKKRLQIVSGLPEKEFERHRSAIATNVDLTERKSAAIARLLSTWNLDPRFTQPFVGTPRELSVKPEGKADESLSFFGLAAECVPQLNPKDLLEELVTLNIVALDPETNTKARVLSRYYIAEPLSATNSEIFGRSIEHYLNTLETNSRKPGPGLGHFDRFVIADYPLAENDEKEFHAFVRQHGAAALELFDAFLKGKPRGPESGRRVGATLFFWVETGVNATSGDLPAVPSNPSPNTTPNESGESDDAKVVIDTLTFKPKAQK